MREGTVNAVSFFVRQNKKPVYEPVEVLLIDDFEML